MSSSPEAQYLLRLKDGPGRRTQQSALNSVAKLCGVIDWTTLDVAGALGIAEKIRKADKAPATVSRWFCAIRGVLMACRASHAFVRVPTGLSQRDWCEDLVDCFPVKTPDKSFAGKTFSWQEVGDFLRLAPNARDAAIMAVGFGAGLRQAELCALDMEDLRPTLQAPDRVIVQDGKGDKPRVAAFIRRFNAPLQAWLHERGVNPGPLFLALDPRSGNIPANPQRLGPWGVGKVMQRVSVLAHVEFSTHDMRRTYATRLLEAKVPLKYVQESLGHSEAKTTLRYQLTSEDEMVSAIGAQ